MIFTGGSNAAMEFLEKYKNNGLLIDIYSNEAHKRLDGINGLSAADFKSYEKKYGTSFHNHLLLISAFWDDSEGVKLKEEFATVYPKFTDYLPSENNNVFFGPQFILINMHSRQVLLAGLGRKHRLFLIDAETGVEVSINAPNDINAAALFGNSDENYLDTFLGLDHAKVARAFLENLYLLGQKTFDMECGITPYEYEMMIALEPDSEGNYETEEGDIFTQVEYEELIEAHEGLMNEIESIESFLKKFWSVIDYSVLCTA